MEQIVNYIRNNWLLLIIGFCFLLSYLYVTLKGNQICDCADTEKYRDGDTRVRRTSSGFRYYHK